MRTRPRTFQQAMTADPRNVDAILAYSVARFATGDYAVASVALRRGLRLYPDVVNSAFDIRDRYGNTADFDAHLKALNDFVRAKPDNVDALDRARLCPPLYRASGISQCRPSRWSSGCRRPTRAWPPLS